MQNPASPPTFRRTCPSCSRPVEPGNKFCATCGTWIPVLSTCSQCGTQFITPLKYCNLCRAPLIQGKVPEPDDSPGHSEEANTGPVDLTLERGGSEIQEPGTDELPDDNDQENIVPADHETPHIYKEEIQEPDTDDLLEQYGREYGEDETLESSHHPKPPSPIKHKAKKPVAVPAPPVRGSPETVNDTLFLSPENPESSANLPVNKTRIIKGFIVLITIVAVVYFIGLPMLSAQSNPPAADITPLLEQTIVGTIPPTLTGIPALSSRDLVPLPTQLIPSNQRLYFQVQKNPVTSRISVIFAGSAGEDSIKSADIKVTHPDGSVATGIIQPLKGVNEIILEGSKETDRVEIIAQMSNGKTYRVYDELIPLMRL